MLPVGHLMIEHRLIEHMISLMEKEVNPQFIEASTSFISDYADRCHHGKEEDILFRELNEKTISEDLKKILHELVDEHKLGRETTARLVEANSRYKKGGEDVLSEITDCLRLLYMTT